MNILFIGTPNDNLILKEAVTCFDRSVVLDTTESCIQAKELKDTKNYDAIIVSSGIIIHSEVHDFLNSNVTESRKTGQMFVLTEFKGEELLFKEKDLAHIHFIPWEYEFNRIPCIFSQIFKQLERKDDGIYTPN